MSLFKKVVRTVSKVVKSVYSVVDNGISYIVKSANELLSAIENVTIKSITGLGRGTLSLFKNTLNPVTLLSSKVTKIIKKNFSLLGEYSRFRDYVNDHLSVKLPKVIDLSVITKLHILERRQHIEEQLYKNLIDSERNKFDIKRIILNKDSPNLISVTPRMTNRINNIQVREYFHYYYDNFSVNSIINSNADLFSGYEIGKDIYINYELENRGSGDSQIWFLCITISQPMISELPNKLDGEWYRVFDPFYFNYSRLINGVWYNFNSHVTRTANSVRFDVAMVYNKGLKTGHMCRFECREARYIKEVR